MSDTWLTSDGRKIPIKELHDTHLVNIIDYFQHNPYVSIDHIWREVHRRKLTGDFISGAPYPFHIYPENTDMKTQSTKEEILAKRDAFVRGFLRGFNHCGGVAYSVTNKFAEEEAKLMYPIPKKTVPKKHICVFDNGAEAKVWVADESNGDFYAKEGRIVVEFFENFYPLEAFVIGKKIVSSENYKRLYIAVAKAYADPIEEVDDV